MSSSLHDPEVSSRRMSSLPLPGISPLLPHSPNLPKTMHGMLLHRHAMNARRNRLTPFNNFNDTLQFLGGALSSSVIAVYLSVEPASSYKRNSVPYCLHRRSGSSLQLLHLAPLSINTSPMCAYSLQHWFPSLRRGVPTWYMGRCRLPPSALDSQAKT